MKDFTHCTQEVKTFPRMQHKQAGEEDEHQLERHGQLMGGLNKNPGKYSRRTESTFQKTTAEHITEMINPEIQEMHRYQTRQEIFN